MSPRSGGYGAAPSGGLGILSLLVGVLVNGFVALVARLGLLGAVPDPVAGLPAVVTVIVSARCRSSVRRLHRVGAGLVPVAVLATRLVVGVVEDE